LGSTNNSVDEERAVMANNRALQDAIGRLVRAQGLLVRPLTDEDGVAWQIEDGVAWQILDDAIGYLIRAEYPLWNLF
jgi:hypothetical protein